MFNYQNEVILNSNIDSSGTAKWSAQAATATTDASMHIKRVNNFYKKNVRRITKRAYSAPVLSRVDFKIDLIPGLYRVALHLRLSGAETSYYANDFVYKGKPLYFEFTVKTGDTMDDVTKALVASIKKFQLKYDSKIVDAKVGSANDILTITAVNEYQRFHTASIEIFAPETNPCPSNCGCETCTFVPYIETVKGTAVADNTIVDGKQGFGTYVHIAKDLRLPTAAAMNYTAMNKEELPHIDGEYNQYVIFYAVDRGVMGSSAVGQLVQSGTSHVFYVLKSVAADFETALATIGTIEPIVG